MIYEVPQPGLACEQRSFPALAVHSGGYMGSLGVFPPLVSIGALRSLGNAHPQ